MEAPNLIDLRLQMRGHIVEHENLAAERARSQMTNMPPRAVVNVGTNLYLTREDLQALHEMHIAA